MLKSYYRLTKPGIIYGNLVTTTAGFFLATSLIHHLYLKLLLSVLAGIALVIASACVFNNYIDRNIDKKMERTKNRAIANGQISAYNALSFATMLGVFGFLILMVWTNTLTVYLGLTAYIFYILLYGWAKRKTVHSTVVGSVAGALPPVAGYAAVTNHLDSGAILVFLALVFWQMPHFYAIAMYRYNDYKNAGLPVLPVKHGMRATKLQILIYIFAFTVSAALISVFGYTGIIYRVFVILLGTSWLILGFYGYRAPDAKYWARKMFFYSLVVNLAISFAIAVGGFLA